LTSSLTTCDLVSQPTYPPPPSGASTRSTRCASCSPPGHGCRPPSHPTPLLRNHHGVTVQGRTRLNSYRRGARRDRPIAPDRTNGPGSLRDARRAAQGTFALFLITGQ